jgi:Common central domain of tyrosinase/Polyphenol oxidase middle domain
MGVTKVARRAGLLAAAALVVLTTQQAGAQLQKAPPPKKAAAPQVRMRWQDFVKGADGAKRLASLQAAIKKMKSLDGSPKDSADFRRSWQYWADIHGYYGAQSPDGTVAQQVAYLNSHGMSSYAHYYDRITDQTAPDATAKAIWATCQHSGSTQALNFFGWHRMYLYYFERVLRWASGDDTLRLPYWDYTDPAQLALPADFRSATSPLYTALRDSDMNAGTATLNANSTNVNTLLSIANYFTYESRIEEGIHGYVHCTTGPTCPVALMGDVPVAGNDPIFYSHHANIDRLWACWQKLHGTPTGTWQDQQFSFVDETGALKTEKVKSFLDSAPLGYVYDNVAACGRQGLATAPRFMTATATAVSPNEDASSTMIGTSKTIAINQAVTSVDLDLPKPQLAAALGHLDRPGAMELVLRDVVAESHPGVLFDVYLARKGDPSKREFAGTISWFNVFHGRHGSGAIKRTLRYDVTEQLRALGGSALSGSGLTVILEATEGRVHTDPAQANVLRQRASTEFRAAAKLQIGAIELRQASAQ